MASYVLYICLFSVITNVVYLVPIDEKPLECKNNERYFKCYHEICERDCKQLSMPLVCASIAPDCYAPACLCPEGQLRSDDGKCVNIEECL